MQLHRGRMADMIPFFLRTQGTPPSPRHGHGMVVVQGACSGVERLCSVSTKASFCNASASTPFDSCPLLSTHLFFHDRKDDGPLRRLYDSGSIQRSVPFNAG